MANDFTFLLQEKWKLGTDKPGSGNTKNIGSVKKVDDLINGKCPFANRGEKVFDNYWTNYLTKDMVRVLDSTHPYKNLEECDKWVENLK